MSEHERDSKDQDHDKQQDQKQQYQMTPETKQPDNLTPLPASAEAEIATGLKRLYGQMLAEPLPDKFAGLLSKLAEVDPKSEQNS